MLIVPSTNIVGFDNRASRTSTILEYVFLEESCEFVSSCKASVPIISQSESFKT